MFDQKLREISLPESGYTVFLATRLSFGDYDDLNSTLVETSKIHIDYDAEGKPKVNPEIDPEKLVAGMKKFTELKRLKLIKKMLNQEKNEVQINHENIVGLPLEDVELIDQETQEIWDNVKKKKTPTEAK